jgi:hypothetical protein
MLLEPFFTHIGLAAFPLVTGAMVVDVLLLLDLADQSTSAVTARDQA